MPAPRTLAFRLLLIAALAALPAAARACSICHCDDPSATAGDLPFFFTQRWRLSVEAEQYAKDQISDVTPAPGEPALREKETENRYTATAAWRAHPKLTLIARVPWAHKEIATGDETSFGTGLSDPELLASACAYRAGSGPKARSITINAGVRLPWGVNDLEQGGERADEHLQPGTGALGLSGGINFYQRTSVAGFVYGTVLGRWNDQNAHDYQYGNAIVVSALYQHDLTNWLSGIAGFDYRHVTKDVNAGVTDPNTGGGLLYFTPRVELALGARFALRLGAQIPIANRLYGDQREFANYQTQLVLRP